MDRLQKQIKITNHQSNSCIIRLNRSLENNDKLKNALKYSEVEEKVQLIKLFNINYNTILQIFSHNIIFTILQLIII